MAEQETVLTKKRRGPAPTGKGQMVGVRLQPDMLAKLDAFIAAQPKPVSRPEAIRQLADAALAEGPRHLEMVGVTGRDAEVVVHVTSEGRLHELPLSVFNASTLVAALYAAQREALTQPPTKPPPEMMLPITNFMIGTSGPFTVLRLYVAESLFQDFAAPKDSPLGKGLDAMAIAVARATGQQPIPFGDSRQ